MSTITPSVTRIDDGGVRGVYMAVWASMGAADTGASVALGGGYDRSVQIAGTFDGATVTLQGSNDGSNWATLTDPQGNGIAVTAATIEAVTELTRYVRAITTGGGASSSLTVSLLIRGQR